MRVDGKGESKRSPLSFKRLLVPDFFPTKHSIMSPLSHCQVQVQVYLQQNKKKAKAKGNSCHAYILIVPLFFLKKKTVTPTLPTPTLLTLTCTQVLWFRCASDQALCLLLRD
jgi:hypothetical protein